MIKVMETQTKIDLILKKVLNKIDLSTDDYLYLQEHQKEVKETHNIELIEIASNDNFHNPSYKFLKVI